MKEKLEEISRILNFNIGDDYYFRITAGYDIDEWESNSFIELFRHDRANQIQVSIIKYYYADTDIEKNIYKFLLTISTDYIKSKYL